MNLAAHRGENADRDRVDDEEARGITHNGCTPIRALLAISRPSRGGFDILTGTMLVDLHASLATGQPTPPNL